MRQMKITKSITNRDSQSVEKYLNEINKTDMITAEQEAILAKKIKEGDEKALEELTKANLRFVVSVAKQYQNQGLSLSDLINEGNIGLMKAARRFDETRSFKFISYAVWWVRQSILQALAEHGRIVRLPLNKVISVTKLNQVFNDFTQKFEKEPTQEELGALLGFSPRELKKIFLERFHSSLDAPVSSQDEDSLNLIDTIPCDYDGAGDIEKHQEEMHNTFFFQNLLNSLKDIQREVVMMYFGFGQTPKDLEAIAETLSLSRERVRQIKEKALKKIRRKMQDTGYVIPEIL